MPTDAAHPQPDEAGPGVGLSPHHQGRSLRRLLRNAAVVGALATVAVHLVGFLVATFTDVRYTFADAGGGGESAVEFAVLDDLSFDNAPDAAVELTAPEAPDSSPSTDTLDLALLTQDAGAPPSLLPSLDPAELSASGGQAALSQLSDDAIGGASGAGSGASFFGLEAQGSRFVYIVDTSASMLDETPAGVSRLELTQRELSRSINALAESAEYLVLLYSNSFRPLEGRVTWTDAVPVNKRKTSRAIDRIYAEGGTMPMDAFRRALRMQPRPDAIYFMTDGRFESSVPGEVAEINGRRPIPVHCIMFGDPDRAVDAAEVAEMMRRISSESGGLFTAIDGSS